MTIDEKLFISNNTTKLFLILDKLINCTYPRSLVHFSTQIDNYLFELKNNPFPDRFDAYFADSIVEQNEYLKNPHNKYILEKLLIEPTIATIDRETKHYLDKHIPSYINDQKVYVSDELLTSKSRKSTKHKLLENYISDAIHLTLKCNDENFKRLEELMVWLSDKQKDYE